MSFVTQKYFRTAISSVTGITVKYEISQFPLSQNMRKIIIANRSTGILLSLQIINRK
jgi:hypothetical protein